MSDSTRQQSYRSHAHRPYLSWAASVFATAALVILVGNWLLGWHNAQEGMVLLAVATLLLVSISRVYITSLQNRIIRLEMRLRLAEILPAGQKAVIQALTTPQLVGLRFASDEELPALVDRALKEKLSRDDIKKAIKTWVPDWERT